MRKRGSGSVWFSRGKWRGEVVIDGRRVAMQPADSRAEAEAILEAVQAARARGGRAVGCLTLAEWGASWLDRRERSGYSGIRTDRSRWAVHVEPSLLAQLHLGTITGADVREWLDKLCRAPALPGHGHRQRQAPRLSRQTIQNTLNLVRVALESAVERGILGVNPARGVHLPQRESDLHRASRHDPWTWLDLQEQQQLLDAVPEPERYVVEFAISTGLRQGEQWNLELCDVHADSPRPHVVVRYGGPNHRPTKGRRVRVVPLLLRAQRAWAGWREATRLGPNEFGLAFPTERGCRRADGACPKYWREWLRDSGVRGQTGEPVCWHSLRHTAASMLVSGAYGRQWSLEEVREFLGHKSVKTTERYSHFAGSVLMRAAAATDAMDQHVGTVEQLPTKRRMAR